MLIGIISDLHRVLLQNAYDALDGCDVILCAGDYESVPLIWELESIAPVIAVRGNCDISSTFTDKLPLTAHPRLGGVRILMTHRPQDVGVPASDVDVVVHGHTHIPRDEVLQGIRYINPGSASEPKGGSSATVVRMTVDEGHVSEVLFVTL
ncbi:MAG: metallophosphatase family protein [Eggerthellaceae bacterium]|jgi:putative phosphoesterase|nr:metallophosphatase family protein [Eggerthellaceae bacterium]MCH4221335.1 metallophosphatase family protein [Eggerthellaceae bacterium]